MEKETNQINGSLLVENARNGVSNEHNSHCPNEDRLSKMPDTIIHHILSFLPAKDVVKTGVLSQRWLYLWTCVPILNFICPDWYDLDKESKGAITLADHHANFINFVKKTLIFHQCTHLKRFSLVCMLLKESDDDFVNTCVRFATRAHVEELCLDLWGEAYQHGKEPYKLPQYLFKNSTITKLFLSCCCWGPTGFISWKMLTSLAIVNSYLSENLIENILAGSPALECLELRYIFGFHCLDISKSNLKKLILDTYYPIDGGDYHPINEFEFELKIIAPKLRSLSILVSINDDLTRVRYIVTSAYMLEDCDLSFGIEEDGLEEEEEYIYHANGIRALLQSLGHVNKLSLGNWCIQNLFIMVMEDMPFPQFYGKCLKLDTSIQKCDFPGIASLLRSAPNLEMLIINMDDYYEYYDCYDYHYDFDSKNYLTSQEGCFVCSLLHLKTVEIHGYEAGSSRCKFVIPFAQFLLKSARVLEKMVIKAQNLHLVQSRKARQPCVAAQNHHLVQSRKAPLPCDAAQAWNRLTQKLLRFPRSSPQAEIIFSK